MIRNRAFSTVCQLLVLGLALLFSASAWAVRETVLYAFAVNGSTGDYPSGGLVADKAGNLYGTTQFGGVFNSNCSSAGCGTVYELMPPLQQGGSWTEAVLYAFQGGSDGFAPTCTLVIDDAGNLYGRSGYDLSKGDYGLVVWELSPPSRPGDSWTESNLYSFPSLGGGIEPGMLLTDPSGNFYGTSDSGGQSTNCGTYGCGAVFEVSPPSQVGGAWSGAILYSFQCGADGSDPVGSLIFDNEGALYGATTGNDNPCGYGTVFKLAPPSQGGEPWTETVLYSFHGLDGQNPYAGLIFDRKGNLYGTTGYGGPLDCAGGRQGCGNVFELSPPLLPGGAWTETVLYNFSDPKTGDGQYPFSNLIVDEQGDLYGTTLQGGYRAAGTIFELMPPGASGGSWSEMRFSLGRDPNGDAYRPIAGLIFGAGKAVLGTGTGYYAGGGVFAISR